MTSKDLAVRTNATVVSTRFVPPPFTLEDTTILYPNFSGRATEYNIEGDRNFNVILTDEQAEEMSALGWNVKTKEGREEGDPARHILTVSIGFQYHPPKIYMLTESQMARGQRASAMSEDLLGLLDDVEYKLVDLVVRAHRWNKAGRTGIKAWVQTLVVIIREDEITMKYADFIEDAFLGTVTNEEIQANNDPSKVDISWDMIEEPS